MIRGVRPDLPTGTVTFLFTDVEVEAGQSPRGRAIRLGQAAPATLGPIPVGREAGPDGEAFFVAFPTAPGAL